MKQEIIVLFLQVDDRMEKTLKVTTRVLNRQSPVIARRCLPLFHRNTRLGCVLTKMCPLCHCLNLTYMSYMETGRSALLNLPLSIRNSPSVAISRKKKKHFDIFLIFLKKPMTFNYYFQYMYYHCTFRSVQICNFYFLYTCMQ